MLTLSERINFVDELANGTIAFLPLCIDHAGGDQVPAPASASTDRTPFEVPGALVIGRTVHGLVRHNGQLLTVGEIFYERPESRQLIEGIQAGERWGVSLCTNLVMDRAQTTVLSKRVTHIGITRDPEFGDENTWIHLAAMSWPAFYEKLATDFVAKEPNMYMSARLRELVAPHVAAARRAAAASRQQVQQVSASRGGVSEPAVRLAPAPGAALPAQHRPSSSQYPRRRAMASDQQQQQQQVRYNRDDILRETDAFLMSLVDPANKSAEMPIAANHLQKAVEQRRALMNYLAQEGIAAEPERWPDEIFDRVSLLRSYETDSVKKTKEFANGFYTDEQVRAHTDEALRNPTLPDNLNYVAQVMASRDSVLKNQRQYDADLAKKNSDLRAKDEELTARTMELTTLKRKNEEAEKLMLSQIDKSAAAVQPPDSKRARIEPAPGKDNTVMIDTAASAHSRAYVPGAAGATFDKELKNARVVAGNNNSSIRRFSPPADANTQQFITAGYLAPWAAADDIRERIERLAGSGKDGM